VIEGGEETVPFQNAVKKKRRGGGGGGGGLVLDLYLPRGGERENNDLAE